MRNTLKPFLAVLAVVALLCTIVPLWAWGLENDNNLITNGGFEQGAEGWTVGGSSAVQTGDAHTGDKAMLLSNTVTWGETLTQVVTVEANTDYTLTFWAKRVSGSTPWDLFIYNKTTMSVLTLTGGNNWITAGTQWTQQTLSFHSGAATQLFLKFCPENAAGGTLLVDDVALREKSAQPDPDTPDTPDQPEVPTGALLDNGGFESGLEGWKVGGNTAIDTSATHGGQNALLLSHPSAWGEALTRIVAVEKDTDYTLSFWYRRVSGNGAWNIFIYDGGISKVLPYTDGKNWFGTSGSEWAQHTIHFNSGSYTSISLKFCPESASAGTFLLDDVSLTKKGEEPDVPDQPDTPDQPTVKPLDNGGFESGLEGWKVGGDTALETSVSHGGQNSVLLSHPTAWAEALTRTVAVEKNTAYTLSFWYKRDSGNGAWNIYIYDGSISKVLPYTSGENWFGTSGDEWVQHSINFNSGDYTSIFLKFCPETATSGTFLLDDVSLTKQGEEPEVPDPPTPPTPGKTALPLSAYTTLQNRPAAAEDNLVKNGSFEAAKSAQWDVDTFLGDTVTVVEDPLAKVGNKSLYFNTSGTTEQEAAWHIFWVEIQPNTDYVFSAWLKGAFMSPDNAARATIGVIDPDTKKFLVDRTQKFSTQLRQIVPPAWDNTWHLRAVTFNSGEKTQIGIALYGYGSQLWVDDIALYAAENGVKYVSPNAAAMVSIRYGIEHTACKNEDSLTENVRMDSASSDFWQSGTGWRNGFMSFAKNKYEYGTSLKYTATREAVGVHYIKWMQVKPHTDYVFSADIKVLQDGYGKLALLDGKKRGTVAFAEVDFSTVDYGEDWFQFVVGFNTDEFTTIGIAVVDSGGEALMDNIRLFEAVDGASVTDPYTPAPKKPTSTTPTQPSQPDEWTPTDPVTQPDGQEQQPTQPTDPVVEPDDDPVVDPDPIEPGPSKPAAPTVSDGDAGSMDALVWVGIAAAILLLTAGCVILFVVKQRKKPTTDA